MKRIVLGLLGLAAAVASSPAQATKTLTVTETFASGATFSGNVTFLDDFSNLTAVTGILSGGTYGSDPIDWIWNPTTNFNPTGGTTGGNFLMDGTEIGPGNGIYTNFITFSYDYADPAHLVFDTTYLYGILSDAGGNNISYLDPFVSGTIGVPAPEPTGWAMMISGIGTIGMTMRRRQKTALQGGHPRQA